MNQLIRKSIADDAQAFVAIKKKLPLPSEENKTTKGGFLLGTDINTYLLYIENGQCLTAIVDDEIVGFGIILPDLMIRKSKLWEKRKSVNWAVNIDDLENKTLAYIEQLAFLDGHRKLALLLSYNLVKSAFDRGVSFLLTTTVKKPICNEAAIPYIKAIGGLLIGNIDETYPDVSDINSDIYLISKPAFDESLKQHSLHDFLKKNEYK